MTSRHSSGFTLVEVILYLGITSIMIVVIASFVQTMFEARIKHQTVSEVEQQGQIATNYISQVLRNAKKVCTPTSSTATTTMQLNLTTTTCPSNTTIDISGGALRINESGAGAINITNSRVTASGISVRNWRGANTLDSVQLTFTLAPSSSSLKNEYTYTAKTFRITGTLK